VFSHQGSERSSRRGSWPSILQADRPAGTVQGHQPRARLPRHVDGALAITGLADIKYPFEPLPPGGIRVPNTNFYRAPAFVRDDLEGFGTWAADEIERAILREGPQSVAPFYLEPVQTPAAASRRPRVTSAGSGRSATGNGVLLVSDEVICAFGRLGYYFGSERYGYRRTSSPSPRG